MSYVVTTGSEGVHVYVTVWVLALDCLGWGVVVVEWKEWAFVYPYVIPRWGFGEKDEVYLERREDLLQTTQAIFIS